MTRAEVWCLLVNLCLMATYSVEGTAQTYTTYDVSFDNAVHHEARIKVRFENLDDQVLEIRMSRSSPGRYAVHEFAKNIYDVQAWNGRGEVLEVARPHPSQWNVSGHDGTIVFEYTLFANRAGGTYSGIDETHAHLNIPATFVWARDLEHRPVKVHYNLPEGSDWRVATQMKQIDETTFYAPDFYYFMDSPTEIASWNIREEQVDGQTIKWILHSDASAVEMDTYFEELMKIVRAQRDVFGELPSFDFGEYTFLSCYVPNASGDGMEHRNSTYVVTPKPNDSPLGNISMGTISHEFFHAWNVERLRPKSLEPFDFEDANISGELWFAEGFTSYYTNLIRVRTGNISEAAYIDYLGNLLSSVINAPGRDYFNPVEMSYRAPFVDAAVAIDPTNYENTFISYYTYGAVIGLGLDLSLRYLGDDLDLDGYMKHLWNTHGKEEIPYTVKDLEARLSEYAGRAFAEGFFNDYIYESNLPEYSTLLSEMGVILELTEAGTPTLGGQFTRANGGWKMAHNALMGSPLYAAGIEKEDIIIRIGDHDVSRGESIESILSEYKPGDSLEVEITRWDRPVVSTVVLAESKTLGARIDDAALENSMVRRKNWLNPNHR